VKKVSIVIVYQLPTCWKQLNS